MVCLRPTEVEFSISTVGGVVIYNYRGPWWWFTPEHWRVWIGGWFSIMYGCVVWQETKQRTPETGRVFAFRLFRAELVLRLNTGGRKKDA